MRLFKSGATRSSNEGKIEYFGFRHPLTELSFGKYMLKHQKQEDGNMRSSSNWWNGWDESISIQSLVRHVEDLQAIESGLFVYKVKTPQGEKTVYLIKPNKIFDRLKYRVSKEEAYNAARFNITAGLLEHLKNKQNEK